MNDLDELKKLSDAATPGPWLALRGTGPMLGAGQLIQDEPGSVTLDGFFLLTIEPEDYLPTRDDWSEDDREERAHADIALIAAMRNALPQLLIDLSAQGLMTRRELDEELQRIDDAIVTAGGNREQGGISFIAEQHAQISELGKQHNELLTALQEEVERASSCWHCKASLEHEPAPHCESCPAECGDENCTAQCCLEQRAAVPGIAPSASALVKRGPWPLIPITAAPERARPIADWHDDIGACLWWRFPIDEPPYSGSPLEDDWPGYHTHWTPFAIPEAP